MTNLRLITNQGRYETKFHKEGKQNHKTETSQAFYRLSD